MNWVVPAGGGLVALLAAAGAAWALRRPRPVPMESAEEAAQAVGGALAGFDVRGAVLAADGMAALAVSHQGRVAVIKRDNTGLAVREVPWTAVRLTPAGLVVETGDRSFGAISLAGIDALEVRRLTP